MLNKTKRRKRNNIPGKGTNLRSTMLLMLRPQGVTNFEAQAAANTISPTRQVTAQLTYIVDFHGYDVRQLPNYDKARRGNVVYKIVGKDTARGYRAFTFNSHK